MVKTQEFCLPPRVCVELAAVGPHAGSQELGLGHTTQHAAKKGEPWTESEHMAFLQGLERFGKGQWRSISRQCVPTRTPTQVASHAQKHFLRLKGCTKRRSRFSAVEQAAALAVADAAPLSLRLGGPAPLPRDAPHFAALQPAATGQSTQSSFPAMSSRPAFPLGQGIAIGIPIGVLPPLPPKQQPVQVATGTPAPLPMLPVQPGRVKALVAYSSASRGSNDSAQPASPLPLEAAPLGAAPEPAGGALGRRNLQLLRLLELHEHLTGDSTAPQAPASPPLHPAVPPLPAQLAIAPLCPHSEQAEQKGGMPRVHSATAALDALADAAEAETSSQGLEPML